VNRAIFFHTVKEAINSCRLRDTDYTAEEIWEIIEDNIEYYLIGGTDSVFSLFSS
jgi:hypothetical protein